jgi:hypothetical protein
LRLRERHLAPTHPFIAFMRHSLVQQHGYYEQAGARYHRMVAVGEQRLGPTHPIGLVSQHASQDLQKVQEL